MQRQEQYLNEGCHIAARWLMRSSQQQQWLVHNPELVVVVCYYKQPHKKLDCLKNKSDYTLLARFYHRPDVKFTENAKQCGAKVMPFKEP